MNNSVEKNDLNQSAAQSALDFLQRFAPAEAGMAEPYVLRLFAALQDGHSYIRLTDDEAEQLASAENIVGRQGGMPLVMQGRRLFLGRMWQLERDLAAEICRLAHPSAEKVDWMQAAQNLHSWFADKGSEGQRDAAALALLQSFMLITGGPGTGKTTTVAKLLGLICSNSRQLPRIALAAPTGKAAAHMARALHRALDGFSLPEKIYSHLVQLEGQTVHRLLELRPPQMQSAYNRWRPLPYDVLVVDEASMLDTSLLLQLLRAVPDGCRVIFLGDEHQLPSVGAGAVLAALSQNTVLSSETAGKLAEYLPEHGFLVDDEKAVPLSQNSARLTVSHRFGADSGIGCLARAVIAKDAESAWAQFGRFPQELEVMQADVKKQAELLYQRHEKYWQAVDSGNVALAYGHAADVAVLAAWRKDAEIFNETYCRHLQRFGRATEETPWFAGQIIMVTRNDYIQDLFNGDIGLIMPDAASANGLAAYFPDIEGFRKTAASRLPAHETAFAMTVHKSQGSEYREVWLVPPSVASVHDEDSLSGLNNALLYTGITRARKRFVFFGSKQEMTAAVETVRIRRTALYDMVNSLF
ncbi:exodeoxyribonuclease V, alpha subunit [Neisseria sp. oral taxon 014 str. F0314]|jgi:exodeoxyribonuclease V, alpha subunit|uniref:exodeoxyribonuclease V subunit alpha n=1 Tax=Neisseria sp. oral taxon 014 TaxID=641148 RepID=UPI0001D8C4A2|nr:exodeoxyribonuclease V subunit alpha [Neisseria sp. oral taxon 014]EFI24280.1 exodeoxyribonuclease V, alpha subunit [Neisseria sp. oral taxon 014 str. F0314]